MNIGALLLFSNAILTTLLSAGIVIWILRKEYLPTIKRLEKEEELNANKNVSNRIKKGS
ncbi:hypothetical protein [Bacillus aerolatus]|uniref:hypothetical protein n=1 Tax=Bacillus aerolatus TaxID=2653354 RepID=UPI00177CE316|nr:hypothetical protein [Bacillus aerolatus]